MGKRFRDKIDRFRSILTSLDERPLGKAALVIVLFLDLFILIAIFNGLDAHTRQLSTPDEFIPASCREIVVHRRWNPTNRIDNLSQIVISYSISYHRMDERKETRHPLCVPYLELVDQIRNDRALSGHFQKRNQYGREAKELQRSIDQTKGVYDTALLETIAKQPGRPTRIDATRDDFQQKSVALDALRQRIASLDQTIDGDEKVKRLWEMIENLREEDRQQLLADLRRSNLWYPARRLGMQMLFLLPLFAVFYGWNQRSLRRGRGVQTLVSSHLLVVSFIPIFFKLVETLYDLIPKTLLKRIFDLLESLKLVAIWHYLVILLAVGAALLLIYLFQKKLFSHKRLVERRIAKGDCQRCGKRLPAGSQACPFCGYAQFRICGGCNRPTHVHGAYCRECGRPSAEG